VLFVNVGGELCHVGRCHLSHYLIGCLSKTNVSSVLPQNNENRVDFFTNHPVMFLFFPNVDGGDVSD
jgi:hypothetical protein